MTVCELHEKSIIWRIAEIVGHAAKDQPEVVHTALASLIFNRIGGVTPRATSSVEPDPRLAWLDTLASEFDVTEAPGLGFSSPRHSLDRTLCRESFLRSLAVVARICGGEIDDPTGGSTRCHRHDETPEWAAGKPPRALIGYWFFY